ncbi:hypothetical protein MHJ85_10225 [Brevibacterium ravenspurgense]|uniref:hypothetical protein n=1 Tax=Brevibacterium ravenspurgense TaxID=479117 RepID=UPI001EF1DF5A|nr:hypothetical protein [Brevibacterium ravenspurgense]MCG7301626.1 hypothetical protein [Brevibacterium ravenspurgense]
MSNHQNSNSDFVPASYTAMRTVIGILSIVIGLALVSGIVVFFFKTGLGNLLLFAVVENLKQIMPWL